MADQQPNVGAFRVSVRLGTSAVGCAVR